MVSKYHQTAGFTCSTSLQVGQCKCSIQIINSVDHPFHGRIHLPNIWQHYWQGMTRQYKWIKKKTTVYFSTVYLRQPFTSRYSCNSSALTFCFQVWCLEHINSPLDAKCTFLTFAKWNHYNKNGCKHSEKPVPVPSRVFFPQFFFIKISFLQ